MDRQNRILSSTMVEHENIKENIDTTWSDMGSVIEASVATQATSVGSLRAGSSRDDLYFTCSDEWFQHKNIRENIGTTWPGMRSGIETISGIGASVATQESSVSSLRGNSSCEDLFFNGSDDCYISETNTEMIDWIVKQYWKALNTGNLNGLSSIKDAHKSQIDIVSKRTDLFIGDTAEKHAALQKVFSRLAEFYYMELRIELEEDYHRDCSTKTLDELRGFDDILVAKGFEEVEFRTPQSKAIWLEEKEYLQETVQNTLLQRIALLTKAEVSWLEKVSRQQYEYFEAFTLIVTGEDGCHWIEIEKNDDRLMELIGYTVYKKNYHLAEYSAKEFDKIKPIAKKIRSQSSTDTVKLSCIFIIYQLNNNDVIEPVFRIKNSQGVLFVDIKQRVYKDWKDFESNNKLPECVYCYPLGGEYNKKEGFRVHFSWSPASYTGKKVIDVLDIVGKVATVGSAAALGAAAAFQALPIAAMGGAVAAVASGAYGVNRSISKILDKVKHVQSVGTQDMVNVLTNVVSVASGGVAEIVPALATVGRSVLFTQSAVQGLTAITALVPEDDNNNIAPQSGELPMKTLLFFNSKSPQEAIEKIRETYDLDPDKSIIFVIKTFVIANSVASTSMGRVENYFSKSLASLVLKLLDAVDGGMETNIIDTLFLRDIFSYGEFTSLDRVFTDASDKEKKEFFKQLMNSVFEISTLCATSIPLRCYRGVEFYPVSKVFEQIDFGVLAKNNFTVGKYLDAPTRKQLQIHVMKILTLICRGDENRENKRSWMTLSHYSNLVKSKWDEILAAFNNSNSQKKVNFETS